MEKNVGYNIDIFADALSKKKQLNRHVQTGLILCIKVHNDGGLVAAPGEL